MSIPIEIERKFVIEMPDISVLSSLPGYTSSDIEQTYLSSDAGVMRRVRARKYQGRTVYTETKKMRIDNMSAHEDERKITREEYETLLSEIMTGTVTIFKTRHTFDFSGRVLEIDIYPNWRKTAILEVELDSREATLDIPDFIKVVAEVTGEKKYSNAAMAHEFPNELI